MTIQYIDGDATQPVGDGLKFIAHVVNNVNRWGSGFVLAVSRRWPEPKERYHAWMKAQEGCNMLGALQLVQVETDIIVANIFGQHGIRSDGDGKPPVRYDAIAQGFAKLARHILTKAPGASVHMPYLGCGLAGGRWENVEPLVVEHLVRQGIPATVYRLPP